MRGAKTSDEDRNQSTKGLPYDADLTSDPTHCPSLLGCFVSIPTFLLAPDLIYDL
jgi:hypothetical protein